LEEGEIMNIEEKDKLYYKLLNKLQELELNDGKIIEKIKEQMIMMKEQEFEKYIEEHNKLMNQISNVVTELEKIRKELKFNDV